MQINSHVMDGRDRTEAQPVEHKPKLLDQVRQAIRARHYSKRTERTYADWIKRFILFHGKRHPSEMAESEINRLLTDLAVNGKVSASIQNQALSAILFLYQHVLKKPLEWIDPAVRAKKPKHLPVVLTREEVKAILSLHSRVEQRRPGSVQSSGQAMNAFLFNLGRVIQKGKSC